MWNNRIVQVESKLSSSNEALSASAQAVCDI
jgi:hypothetical protein